MYPSSTPPLDRGHCPRHFAGVEEGFTKWEEVLLIVNICDSTSVQFNGPEKTRPDPFTSEDTDKYPLRSVRSTPQI